MSDPLNPDIWFPHLFFMLQTAAHCYPGKPNAIMKRKYYDFIQNLPILMPCPYWQSRFSDLLDQYPISPFLGSRDDFHTWLYFIRNDVYKRLGRGEVSSTEFNDQYYGEYLPKPIIQDRMWRHTKTTLVIGMVIIGIVAGIYLTKW
jgi:hypothetical protein